MNEGRSTSDVIVVGGGLAGLTAATFLARVGKSVILFEKSRQVGGRAQTQAESGFLLNLGPHALYRAGLGIQILRELGVEFNGGVPATGGLAVKEGTLYQLPASPVSILITGLLRLPARLELTRRLATLSKVNTQAIQHLTVEEWLAGGVRWPEVRQAISAFIRLATYANAPELQSAGAALRQAQMTVTDNVYYLDGGWQTLVNGLRRAAQQAGVRIVMEARVTAIVRDGAVRGVRLADGTTHAAAAVVVAAGPADVCALVEDGAATVLQEWADTAIPIRAACLDVGLRELPNRRSLFALGIDSPIYLSVHSAVAQLGPPGGAMIHVAKYLDPMTETEPRADERELEQLLDLVQPGWRGVLVTRRFLPRMLVSNALVTAAQGGTAGRPGPAVPGIPGLYVAGDWVGPHGMLSDASLASGQQAAQMILADRGVAREMWQSPAVALPGN